MTFSELLKLVFKSLRLWVFVAPWEQCVRIRLGKYVKLLSSGMHLTLPGVDRVIIQASTLRIANVYSQSVMTCDGKLAVVRCLVAYRVVDLMLLCKSTANPEDAILDTVGGVVAKLISTNSSSKLSVKWLSSALEESISLSSHGIHGIDIASIKCSDLIVTSRAYRLLTDKVTEYNYGSKVSVSDKG